MKTINEIASNLGVSRQTIYNVINDNGISLDSLTIDKAGKKRLLKDEAEDIIKHAMSKGDETDVDNGENNVVKIDNVLDKNALKKAIKETKDTRRELKEASETIRIQAEELDKLRRELAEAEERIKDQSDQLDRLRTEADALRENNNILIRTNATNALTIQSYREREQMKLADGGEDRRAGWFRRTLRRITGKGDQKE